MDNSRNIVTIFVLVVTLLLLETGKMGDCASPNELVHHKVDWLSHMRGKRNVFSAEEISTVDILLNASNVESLEQIQSTLHATSFPVHLDDTEILNITVTTVCLSADDGIQCKCEGQYAWPYSTCIAYGACDSLSSGICKCIRGIPTDNSTCQPVSELHVQTEYEVELQLNLTDITTLNFLKAFLNSAGLYLSVSPTVNVTQIDLTTVCSPFNGNYQCRCEDQYHWTYDQCRMYGSCDSITYDTCGCINAIPPDGQFCRSVADDSTTVDSTTFPPLTITLTTSNTQSTLDAPILITTNITTDPPITNTTNNTATSTITTTSNITTATSIPTITKDTIAITITNNITTTNIHTTTNIKTAQPIATITNITTPSNFPSTNNSPTALTIPTTTNIKSAPTIPTATNITTAPTDPTTTNSTTVPTITSTTNFSTDSTNPTITTFETDQTITTTTNITAAPTIPTTSNITITPIVPTPTNITTAPTFPTTINIITAPTIPTISNITTIPNFPTTTNIKTDETFPTTTNITFAPIVPTTTNITTTPNITATTNFSAASTNPTTTTIKIDLTITTTNITTGTKFPTTTNSAIAQIVPNTTNITTAPTIPTTTNITTAPTTPSPSNITTAPSFHTTTNITIAPIVPTPTNITAAPSIPTTTNITTTPNITAPTNFSTASTNPTTTNIKTDQTLPTTINIKTAPTIPTTSHITTAPKFPTTTNITTAPAILTITNITTTPNFTATTNFSAVSTNPTTTTIKIDQTITTTTNITTATNFPTTTNSTIAQIVPNITNITTAPTIPTKTNFSTASTNPTTINIKTGQTITTTTNITTATNFPTTANSTIVPIKTAPNILTPTGITTAPTIPISTAPIFPMTSKSTTVPNFPTTTNITIAPTIPTTNITAALTVPSTTNIKTAPTIITIPTITNITTAPNFTTTTNITITYTIPTTANIKTATNVPTTTNFTISPTIPTTTKISTASTMFSTTKETAAAFTVFSTAKAVTTVTTTTTSTSTTSSTTAIPIKEVALSVTLDMEYKPDYNNKDSIAYKDLESRIIPILQKQYGGIKGFISVFVTRFRKGSVIIDFTVKTSQIDGTKMTEANKNLTGALREIAPVIESAVAQYYSPTNLVSSAAITYTGQTMMLTCGPPDFNIGTISQNVWKFKDLPINSIRFKSSSDGNQSTLTVSNVILSDAGLYTCILMGEYVYFHQNKTLSQENIRAAPVVQVKSEIPVKCQVNQIQSLECCVQSPFTVKWYNSSVALLSDSVGGKNCTKYNYKMENCNTPTTKTFTCKVENISLIYEAKTKLTIFVEDVICKNNKYGDGRIGDKVGIMCGEGLEGHTIVQCQEPGVWKLVEDTCIITIIKELLTQSKDLVNDEVKNFTGDLRTAVMEKQHQISNSSSTISAIVNMLTTIATVSTEINKVVMENVLQTVDFIISDGSKETWISLNSNLTNNSSSELLGSMETISEKLNGTFDIATQNIQLNRTMFSNYLNEELNSTVSINLEDTALNNVFITTLVFSTLYNVMPTRNSMFNFTYFNTTGNETDNGNAINAAVLLVKLDKTNVNVSLSYKKHNTSLSQSPQCVFWNFSLFDKLGAWDNEGCEFVSDINGTVTCNCSHLTSFSILMSTSIPPDKSLALDIITYIGVGISLASLVMCLVIEGIVWRALTKNSTAFMRHVSIVNTALSLLMADICFIVSAYVANNLYDNPNRYKVPIAPCSAVTFFMHFFYLALFFWMLVSGLLLLYRTVMVFSHMSKWIMLALGFLLGYGCPLIIAVITVAVTAPKGGYIKEDQACWLNWSETKALLAMVIPALTIVVINIFIIIVVLFKMLRRRMGKTVQADENHTLVVIIRCVAILTPLFGLTWSLGIGTMVSPTNDGIHIAFAFFNSLQGFFILVFGTLFDSKIRSLISRLVPTLNSGSKPTKSTTAGISSFSGLKIFNRFCGKRHIYHVSRVANSSNSSGASESFNKI